MAHYRSGKAAERFAERRRREDDAPRLQEVAPTLDTLRLELEERSATAETADVKYVRHIVVARAPALFVLQCTDRSCQDGEHDLTHEILYGLSDKKTQIEGEDRCYGSVGTAECGRVLRYLAIATYQ